MSRIVPQSRGKERIARGRSQGRGYVEKNRIVNCGSADRPNRRVLVLDRHKTSGRKTTDAGHMSAFLFGEKILGMIQQEVDSLSKNWKTIPPDAQVLSEAFHRMMLCAVKQSVLDNELRSLALTDDLTRLYNRRAFYALSTQQLKVMRRRGQGLLLFFADVDDLKSINDTFGHREGDLALVRTADALQRTFRNSDIVARLSGDEFAVLALEASCQDQDAILRRLEGHLQKVSAEELRYKLSVSVGAARFDPKNSVPLEDLLAKADQAMYEQKSAHFKMRLSRP
jgi:diguanylate cyclase (GGDEF)-like protein